MQFEESSVSPSDARIMLRLLVAEAARFHQHRMALRTAGNLGDRKQDAQVRTPPALGWHRLMAQIEEAWFQTASLCTEERYQRLKCRITTLLLWDVDACNGDLDFNRPPIEALENMQKRHASRLRLLPRGQLFYELAPISS